VLVSLQLLDGLAESGVAASHLLHQLVDVFVLCFQHLQLSFQFLVVLLPFVDYFCNLIDFPVHFMCIFLVLLEGGLLEGQYLPIESVDSLFQLVQINCSSLYLLGFLQTPRNRQNKFLLKSSGFFLLVLFLVFLLDGL
jgi:hypothetical protein